MNLPDDIIKYITDFLPYDENIKDNILNKDLYNYIQNGDSVIVRIIIYNKKKHYKYRKRFKKLFINNDLDHTLTEFTNLTEIVFDDNFNKSICIFLPSLIEKISFGKYFNLPIDGLPDNINSLSFSYSFNKSINKLPNNLLYLSFGNNFNRPLFNLPENLKVLKFGDCFNNNLILSPNLEEIYFGLDFNREILDFPNTLKVLHFGARYNQPLHLPINLEEIRIYILYNKPIILPKTVKKMIVWGFYGDNIDLQILKYKLRRLLTYEEPLTFVIENSNRERIKTFSEF